MFLLFMATNAFAQQQKVLNGGRIVGGVSAIEENGKGALSVQGKQGTLARNLSKEDNYIQLTVEKSSRFYITGKKFQLPPICPRPGVYTIPAAGNEIEKQTSFHVRFFPGDFEFSDFKSFAAHQSNSVFVEKKGEDIVIFMPVKEKPDSLSHYAICGGRWEKLEVQGTPVATGLAWRASPPDNGGSPPKLSHTKSWNWTFLFLHSPKAHIICS